MKRLVYQPRAIEIEMTHECNLRCRGCAILDDIKKSIYGFTGEEVLKILSQAKKNKIDYFSLTGGEPFLHFDILKKILKLTPLDLIKINTNGFIFSTPKKTRTILGELKDSGFAFHNRTIPAWLNISIGQQTAQGIPLENAVFVAREFGIFFPFDKGRLSLNVFSPSRKYSLYIIETFLRKYKDITNQFFDQQVIPIKYYDSDGRCSSTALKLGRESPMKKKIKELISEYIKDNYLGLDCNFINELETFRYIGPRMLLRADGSVYSCIGFSHVYKLGNIYDHSLEEMISKANKDIATSTVFRTGLFGLVELAEKYQPGIGEKMISESFGPCDVCRILTGVINNNIYNQ